MARLALFLIAFAWLSFSIAADFIPAWRDRVVPWPAVIVPVAFGIAFGIILGTAISADKVLGWWKTPPLQVLIVYYVFVVFIACLGSIVSFIHHALTHVTLADLNSAFNPAWPATSMVVLFRRARAKMKETAAAGDNA